MSLDCVIPRINDLLIGKEGHTERMLATMDEFKRRHILFACNSVITPFNLPYAIESLDYLLSNYGDVIRRITMTPYGRSIYRHRDDFFVTSGDLSKLRDHIGFLKEKFPKCLISVGDAQENIPISQELRKVNYEKRAQCSGNHSNFVILPDGTITVCEELYYHPSFVIGSIRDQSIMEMWNGKRAIDLAYPDQNQVKDGACSTCTEFIECHHKKGRCFKKTLQAYGLSNPDWPDPNCPYAPQGNVC
jgi:radical SAM protein with 4Fe4S-binding SPASM domain